MGRLQYRKSSNRTVSFRYQKIALDGLLLLILGVGIAVVLVADGYIQFVLGLVAITTILCVGLNVLYGLTGLVSLGQVGFFAIGAYTTGVCLLAGISFWLALLLAAIIATAAGAILALSAVRMAGPFLAMVTIAFAFIVEHGATEWRSLTGGQNGLMGFSMPEFFGYTLTERDLVMVCVVLAVASLFFFRLLVSSG